MARTLFVLLLACLAATSIAAFQNGGVVLVDDESNDVEPRVILSNALAARRDSLLRWYTKTTPRTTTRTTPRYKTTTKTTPRYKTTTRRPTSTTRSSRDQSITIGGLYPYDRQLVVKTVYKSSTFLIVNTEYLNVSNLQNVIHCIQIVDQQRDGQNAVATVQAGGVGHNNVSIKFKSQRGGKINYVVIIWGQ